MFYDKRENRVSDAAEPPSKPERELLRRIADGVLAIFIILVLIVILHQCTEHERTWHAFPRLAAVYTAVFFMPLDRHYRAQYYIHIRNPPRGGGYFVPKIPYL